MTILLCFSCIRDLEQEHKATISAKEFCEHFFYFQFDKAIKGCAKGEDGWLKMYVSNISSQDEENIRNADFTPEISVDDYIINEKDSSCRVMIKAKDIYFMQQIGLPGSIIDEGTFKVDMILESDSVWRVKMVTLLQSEK